MPLFASRNAILTNVSIGIFTALALSCSWLSVSAEEGTERPLEGLRLQCCTAPESMIIEKDANAKPFGYKGMGMTYLLQLQERLGFRCETVVEFKNNDKDGVSFNSILENIEACTDNGTIRDSPECKCEMAVGGWSQNSYRFGKVDYLPPFVIDGTGIVVHTDNTSSASAGAFFVTAFATSTWLLVLALIGLFTFLKLLDSRFALLVKPYEPLPEGESRFRRLKHYLLKSPVPRRLRLALQSTLDRMMQQGSLDSERSRPTTRQWVLNLLIAFCSLFLILAYESSMTAVLVQKQFESEYRNIRDLQTCQIPPQQVCVPRGGAIEILWNTAIASHDCHKRHGEPIFVDSYEKGEELLYEKTCKFLLASLSSGMHLGERRYCGKVTLTGEPCLRGGSSFLLPRDSNLTEPMSRETLDMLASGLLPSLEEHLSSSGRCGRTNTSSLTAKQLQLFFIFVFSACLVIFFEMVLDPQSVRTNPDAPAEKPSTSTDPNEMSSVETQGVSSRGNARSTFETHVV